MENTSRHRNEQTNSVPKEQEGAAYRVTCTPGLYAPDFEYFYARQIFIISDKSGTTSFASRMESRLFLRTASHHLSRRRIRALCREIHRDLMREQAAAGRLTGSH